MKQDDNRFLLYFGETGKAGGADRTENVVLLKNETKDAVQRYRVRGGRLNGRLLVRKC